MNRMIGRGGKLIPIPEIVVGTVDTRAHSLRWTGQSMCGGLTRRQT